MMSIDPIALVAPDVQDDAPVVLPLAVVDQSIQDSWQASSTSSLTVSQNTGEKPQSKVWTHGGDWFAAMPNSSGSWIWRLDNGNWTQLLKLSNSNSTHADVKAIGNVAHILLFDDSSTQLASVQYVAATRSYELWSARPDNVNISLPSSTETASIDVDSLGRMWLAYDNKSAKTVEVRYSDGNYATWSGPITVATGINSDDIAGVVAMGNGQIGVMWSNQNTKRFGFRTHDDGADPNQWNAFEVPAEQSAKNTGSGMADDHLNLAAASDGTVYAAVKTSYDSSGATEIALLVRRPDGSWDPLYEVSTRGTRPIVVLNEALGRVIVAYTKQNGGGDILYNESSTSSISFGPARVLIGGSDNNVTSTKQTITGELLVLASSSSKARGTLLVGPVGGPTLPLNQPPQVNAGPDRSTPLGTPVALQGSASDDGQPDGSLALQWTMVSGPGLAFFGNDDQAATNVTFSTVGIYRLRLTASDGSLSSSDDVVVEVRTNTPPEDIVGFWNFRPGIGASYPSVIGHLGSVQGGATVDGDGRLVLGGGGQRYEVSHTTELEISQAITITAWIKPSAIGTQYVVKKSGQGSGDGFELSLSSSGKVFVRFNEGSSGDSFRLDSQSSYPINGTTWMHVAATYDGTTIRLYINGQEQASRAASFSIATNNLPLNLGAGNGGIGGMRGQLDEVMIASRALSAGEIAQVHFGSFDPTSQANQPPVVSAGPDRAAETDSPVTLAGTVSDDGRPSGSLTSQWTVVSGPGNVLFGNPSEANTTATFTAVGQYVLRLTASDGALSASDTLTVVVTAPTSAPTDMVGFWNFMPGKGASYPSVLGNTGSLQGGATVSADGRLNLTAAGQRYVVPNAAELQISQAITITAWIKPSASGAQHIVKKAGNGTTDGFELSLSETGKVFVRFNEQSAGDSLRVDSVSNFPTNGNTWMHVAATYDGSTIRLYVNGQLQGSKSASFTIGTNNLPMSIGSGDGGYRSMRGQLDEVLVANRALSASEISQVHFGSFDPTRPPDGNQPPNVSAGADRTTPAGIAITLAGLATDDGQPSGVLLSQWSVVSGPGGVSFANASDPGTAVTFLSAGTYVLRLTATDGALSASDDLTVVVTAAASPSILGFWNFLPGIGASYPSAIGNTGNLQGGASVSGDGRLALTGPGQSYAVPDMDELQISQEITITAWIKPSAGGTQHIVKKAGNGTTDGFELSLSDSGKVFVRFNEQSAGNSLRVDSISNFPTNGNSWMHVAATYDGTTIRLYVNGQLEGSKAASFTIGTNNLPLHFGSGDGGQNAMRGQLDEVLIDTRALSAAEISQVHFGTFRPAAPSLPSAPLVDPEEQEPTAPPVASSGIVGRWGFDDTSDSSGQGNHGTLQDGASLGAGHSGNGLVLSGSNQRMVVPDSPSLDVSQAITIAAWIQPSTSGTQYIVKKAEQNTVDGFELSLSSAGRVFVRFNQASSGDSFRVDSTSKYPTNGSTWMHVVATYDGTTIRLFVNGVEQGSKAASFTIGVNDLALAIGAEPSGFRSMRGAIDDVLLANRALTSAEIQALYAGTYL